MKLPLLAMLAIAVAAGPAQATTALITYTGTVRSGVDKTDMFGTGTDISGEDFILRFWIDTATPSVIRSSSSELQYLMGFGDFGGGIDNNPIRLSSFTIGGKTLEWRSSPNDGYNSSYGYADRYNEYDDGGVDNYDEVWTQSTDYAATAEDYTDAYAFVRSWTNEVVPSASVPGALDYSVMADDSADGVFLTQDYNPPDDSYPVYTRAFLDPTRVTVALATIPVDPAAMPGPASWTMMIAGFGLIGAAMRRGRALGQFG